MAGINDAEYVELFLAEARENLETLNTAIVGVEADPADRENLDAVFRVAHSVKGMAATMGYEQVAELTHAMEDVFALLRERSGGLEREAIDVLFECMDMLAKLVEEIAEHGESRTDPTELEQRLRGLVRNRDDAQGPEVRAAVAEAKTVTDAEQPDLVVAAVKDAQSRATVRVEAARLDTLLHMIGELVGRRASVEQLAIENGDARLLAAAG